VYKLNRHYAVDKINYVTRFTSLVDQFYWSARPQRRQL